MQVRTKENPDSEFYAGRFNVCALDEVEGCSEAFGVDLFYIKDLDVWIEGLGKWKDMRLAFRDKDLIIDNHNTVFFEPENEDERKRGYRL